MSDSIKLQTARNEQSAADKKNTLDLLKSKRKRTRTVTVDINGEKVELTFQAVSYKELDKLQAKHPPTAEQRMHGAAFNRDTFPPALVAACLTDPEMTYNEARDLWESDEWTTGELNALFDVASNLCMAGLDIPFTGTGSE